MDYGHKWTDEELKKLEARIYREYKQAAKETKAKLEDYFRRYEVKNKLKLKALDNGEITQDEYKRWLTGQIAIGERWQEMVDTLAEDYRNVNKITASMTREFTYEAYALNHNYGTFEAESGSMIDTSYTLYDRHTVERLIRDNPDLLPPPGKKVARKIAEGSAVLWDKRLIQSVMTQSILQGEPMPKIATRLAQAVSDSDMKAAIRNARTMTTGAENAGRVDSYKRAESMGIKMMQEWIATLDNRTRHEHRQLDGQKVEVGDDFKVDGYTIRFPGDPQADPEMVYNCRCTVIGVVAGTDIDKLQANNLERNSKLGDMSYEEWKNEHSDKSNGVEAGTGQYVNGNDISSTWQRRPDKFDFEIEDVINAQGFDGLPKVVSADEFDEAVKLANGGNGFIAQRTYSAPNQEILDGYRDQLYNGKWYVDCSTGGAQYGQGMYCAADYTGKLSRGIENEMQHYIDLQDTRIGYNANQAINDAQYKYAISQQEKIYASVTDPTEQAMLRKEFLSTGTKEDRAILRSLSDDEYDSMYERLANVRDGANKAYSDAMHMSREQIADMFNISEHAPHYIETITLDPSAKIANYRELSKEFDEYVTHEQAKSKYNDIGSYAAAKGYDAINAEGHGQSGSYTVILNRTKVIIKEDRK